jgi:hypothetical protein
MNRVAHFVNQLQATQMDINLDLASGDCCSIWIHPLSRLIRIAPPKGNRTFIL